MKKTLHLILCAFLLQAVILTTACPQAASLEKAETTSRKIAGYANDTVNVTRDLYRASVITPEQANRIAARFVALARGGQAFDRSLAEIKVAYGAIDHVPQNKLNELAALFNSGIVEQFISALTELKIVGANARLRQMIELIKTSVLIVARAFSLERPVAARIREAS